MTALKFDLTQFYKDFFNPSDYCSIYYDQLDEEVKFFLDNFYFIFSEGKTLLELQEPRMILEIGCGPVPIYASTSVAANFSHNIVVSEILDSNRDLLEKWRLMETPSSQWKVYYDHLESLCNIRSADIERSTRISIKDVCRINLLNDSEDELKRFIGKFSVVMSTLCLEFVSSTMEEYVAMIRKCSSMLNDHGVLIMGGALRNTFYSIRNVKFPSLYLTEADILGALQSLGLTIIQFSFIRRKTNPTTKPTDHSGVFFIAADKGQ